MKRMVKMLLVACTFLFLTACGAQVNENGVPTQLKEKYVGTSKDFGYYPPFHNEGGHELNFDLEKMEITDGQAGKIYFKVIPEDKLPSEAKGSLLNYKEDMKGKTSFSIAVSYHKEDVEDENFFGGFHQIILSDGGKSIRVIELDEGGQKGYYDFIGVSE